MATSKDGTRRTVALAVGTSIGILWLAMAAAALKSAADGLAQGRSDWALGWGLVGGLLAVAGGAAAIGTWWHHFRVLRQD